MELVVEPMRRLLAVQAGANLLDTLRGNDVPISYSCMSGRCGTCRCRLVAGDVLDSGKERQGPLTTKDRYVLACQTTLIGPCTIEIPEPDEVVMHPARIIKASVTSIENLTHDIKRLRMRPAKPLAFSPGQYAHLQFTPQHVRPYSMAQLPFNEDLEFHVRLVPEGRVTTYIADTLKLGDTVRVTGPLGTAYLRQKHTGPMLCVAGGTGLAPILSIVRGAVASGMDNPIHLYFGVRSSRDLYGSGWLEELQQQHPRLNVHVVVADGTANAGQRTGLVTDAVARDWNSLAGWRAYLCGAPPMVEALTLMVGNMGIAPERIHADAFYSNGT